MKSAVPGVSGTEGLSSRIFESRSRNNDPSALSGSDKRIFRFMCGEERTVDDPSLPDPSSATTSRTTSSIRLFCSQFIRINNA